MLMLLWPLRLLSAASSPLLAINGVVECSSAPSDRPFRAAGKTMSKQGLAAHDELHHVRADGLLPPFENRPLLASSSSPRLWRRTLVDPSSSV
jgi:hypothetical protein